MEDELELLRSVSVNRIFSSADAERVGVPRLRLVTLRTAGLLGHPTRGMWSTTWSDDLADVHLLRTVAIMRRQRVTAGATAHSALVLHDLPLVDVDLTWCTSYVVADAPPAAAATTRCGVTPWT